MRIHDLKPADGTNKARKRVGRGIGSGSGKTSGRGHKGMGQRSGGGKGPGFEGGQTPLQRRLPKRGFNNIFQKEYAEVKLAHLNGFEPNTVVTPNLMHDKGLIRKASDQIKILGGGSIDRPLTVLAHGFTKSAAAKIEEAGGKAEVI